jgi:hypothetical protein
MVIRNVSQAKAALSALPEKVKERTEWILVKVWKAVFPSPEAWLFGWRTFVLIGLLVWWGYWQIWIYPQDVAWEIGSKANLPLREVRKLEYEVRDLWMKVVAGVGAGIGLLLSWLRSWLTSRDVAVKEREIKVTESADLTDRYTKAVEMLGAVKGEAPNLEVRLGAIYALEAMAKDSDRFYPTVLEVLSAYVRENTRKVNVPEGPQPGASRKEYQRWVAKVPKPRLDVQAAVTVLGRVLRKDRTKADPRIDLQGAILPRLYAVQLDLRFANLIEAQMQGADLREAQMQGANLRRVQMQGADLREAQMQDASLRFAQMQGADLREAQMQGAKGIKVNQILEAQNWESATFDDDFRKELEAEAAWRKSAGREAEPGSL